MDCSHSVPSTEKLFELSWCFYLIVFICFDFFFFLFLPCKLKIDTLLLMYTSTVILKGQICHQNFQIFFHTSAFPKVLSAATIVAKHTSALCNACRLASSKTSNPVAKRQFVQSAKEVANSTANLVKSIKVSIHFSKCFCLCIKIVVLSKSQKKNKILAQVLRSFN